MLANSNNSEKYEIKKNFHNFINSELIVPKFKNSGNINDFSSSKFITQYNKETNTTSLIFNNLMNNSKFSNLISENNKENRNLNEENKEQKIEKKKDIEYPVNKAEENYIVIDSDEDNEENDSNIYEINNINETHESNINSFLNNKRMSQNKFERNDCINKLNIQKSQKPELQENIPQNYNNENNKDIEINIFNKRKINDKDKFIDTEIQVQKKFDRKLYYIRKITSNRKYKLKGIDKLNIQFFIGNIKPDEMLPYFVFSSEKYYYVPHKCRQIIQNYKGYIISFPGLKQSLNNKIIKKDLEYLCTYYFKNPLRKTSGIDIKVQDEKTLNDGVFLNDGIINFYLKIIEDEYIYDKGKLKDILILKSYFYNSLSVHQKINLSNDFSYPDSCSYKRTNKNIFSYKTLIIPTCDNNHWSLIIVNDIDKMKNIFSEENLKAFRNGENYFGIGIRNQEQELDYPEIFYLDSFYYTSKRRIEIILKYLFYEYQKVYSIDLDMNYFILKNYHKIECYNPYVPKQKNNYDCGIFLLMYAELFLYNTSFFLQNVSKKYRVNKNNEIIKIGNNGNTANVEGQNKSKEVNEKYIINNNLINNFNIINPNNPNNSNVVNNTFNINNNKSKDICNINNSKKIRIDKQNTTINNNILMKNDEPKKEEIFIETGKNGTDSCCINENNNNKTEYNLILENNKIKDNKESNEYNKNINNFSHNTLNEGRNNLFISNFNYNELSPEEKVINNWFSYDLVNKQRTKIKNLINELSKIDRKKELSEKMKEQNIIITKYINRQKKEFDEYFDKLKV